jgi:hypothetical protein
MAHYRSCGCVVENDIVLMPCAKHSRPRAQDAVQSEIAAILSRTMTSLESEMLRVLLTERNTTLGLLRKYGRHTTECRWAVGGCKCGWDDVLKTLEEK